jgi:hypothetical protein
MFPRASSGGRGVFFWLIRHPEVMEGSVLCMELLPHLKVNLTSVQDLRAKKERRLEEISARMKSQRLEAEERKKQKEIKFTDRVPPMKRARGCEWFRAAYLYTSFLYASQGLLLHSKRVCSRKHVAKPQKYRRRCSNHVYDHPCQPPRRLVVASRTFLQSHPHGPTPLKALG